MAEVCTNYRYAKRHDPAHMPKADEEKKDDGANQETQPVKRASKVQKKAGGKSKKDPAQIEAEEKAAKEEEEKKKLKEAENDRKRAEELARAAYRPKDYTQEEKDEWDKLKADLEQFFSSIVVKQSNDAPKAAEVSENGEEEKKIEAA